MWLIRFLGRTLESASVDACPFGGNVVTVGTAGESTFHVFRGFHGMLSRSLAGCSL